jgi:hypothetical protein
MAAMMTVANAESSERRSSTPAAMIAG